MQEVLPIPTDAQWMLSIHHTTESVKKATAPISGWDFPLLPSNYPGLDCGSFESTGCPFLSVKSMKLLGLQCHDCPRGREGRTEGMCAGLTHRGSLHRVKWPLKGQYFNTVKAVLLVQTVAT